MNVAWSPHANSLFLDILAQIEDALSIEDAFRWRERILDDADRLADFPFSGPIVPVECFHTIPAAAFAKVFAYHYSIGKVLLYIEDSVVVAQPAPEAQIDIPVVLGQVRQSRFLRGESDIGGFVL